MEIPVISRAHAAEELGVSVSTLRRMEQRGVLTPARSISDMSKTMYYDRKKFWSEVKNGLSRDAERLEDA
tara:strand:+ start:5434 stop:5643 length:210 start_codon:yes stop_codon:yes gene_type:complete